MDKFLTGMERYENEFTDDLVSLINKYSVENDSDTPDFILALYLISCLKNFNRYIESRDNWYGVHLEPGNKYFEDRDGD